MIWLSFFARVLKRAMTPAQLVLKPSFGGLSVGCSPTPALGRQLWANVLMVMANRRDAETQSMISPAVTDAPLQDFTKTEMVRAVQLSPVDRRESSPKGLGRAGYEPLMQNRPSLVNATAPTGYTGDNTFSAVPDQREISPADAGATPDRCAITHSINIPNGVHGATLNAEQQPLQCGSRDLTGRFTPTVGIPNPVPSCKGGAGFFL